MNINPNYDYKATVTNVVDGDTIDAIVDLGFHIFTTQRFRLFGVDTPELRGPKANPEAANAAKDFTTKHLLNQNVIIRSFKSDSFGRWLCIVQLGNENFNEMLIEAAHAKEWRR